MHLNGNIFTYKFGVWRRQIVNRFLKTHGNLKNTGDIKKALARYGDINLLVWSVRQQYELPPLDGLNIVSVEDGFIRSVGLGAEHSIPISLVFDRRGIYFDSTRESDLEHILKSMKHDEEILEASRKIMELIKNNRINKYNLREKEWKANTTKKLIVVPGQVEGDKSIKYGSPFIKDNLTLLKEARSKNSDAYIVFKVHPDIYRKCRLNHTKKSQYYEYADEVLENVSSFSLIENADEIHTMTSLFGFEALLHGKRVVCYGQPFYSGWGLTEDIYPVLRRDRKLTIEELIYGTYFVYPVYVSLFTGQTINAIEAIMEISKIKYNKTFIKISVPLKERIGDALKKTFISIKEILIDGTFKRI